MSLQDIEIKQSYRSGTDDIPKAFYIPLLGQAVSYKRAVGFFSSTVLSKIYTGISALANKGGTIQLVASPKLSDEDIEAIRSGYKRRDTVMRDAVLRELTEPRNDFEKRCLNQLANLIADGILDIKMAVTEKNNKIGMYHEKMGLITDDEGNTVAFSGSMNESLTAVSLNYEAIDIFCSWKSEEQRERVEDKQAAFSAIWNNTEPDITVLDFPELTDEIIQRYKREAVEQYESYDEEIENEEFGAAAGRKSDEWITQPDWLGLYDYQIQAIDKWQEFGFRGIFDMATGTGKTLTALGGLQRLSQVKKSNLGIVIVCPYQHLIEQWVEDIEAFGITPLRCYSAVDWKKKFRSIISDFRFGVVKNFCFITTNDTLASDYFQKEIDKLKGNICLVVDEAHNFGAKKQLDCMKEVFQFRLALSATLTRHHDEYGTQRLTDYFGEKCIEYSLERAIKEDKLTPYYYYPIPVYFDPDELEDYNEITDKIINILRKSPKDKLPKAAEMLLIQRARIVAAARNKLTALRSIIAAKYTHDSQMLIYCGATTVRGSGETDSGIFEEDKKQIAHVVEMLGKDFDMKSSKFTAEENSKERQDIKEFFQSGMLQALVAIRCLDEGMNIPGIRTAFILASSTNPKEYIQRRGRVLRKAPNKPYATIYDFITLPRDLDNPVSPNQYLNSEYSLIRREYERMEDFARLSENPSDVIRLQDRITTFYNLYYSGGQDYGI
jgi:superfamily II DNA or RNA helicase